MSVSLEKLRNELADLAAIQKSVGAAPELARRVLAALPESGIVLSAEEVERLERFLRLGLRFDFPYYIEALAILRGEGE